jgi:hypothetical protein
MGLGMGMQQRLETLPITQHTQVVVVERQTLETLVRLEMLRQTVQMGHWLF